MKQVDKHSTNKTSKLLLFGGTGKLGKELSAQASSDIELFTPSHNECDITKLNNVITTIRNIKPDTIINAAAIVGVNECEKNRLNAWNTNVIGTLNIAKACAEKNIRLIFISSAVIFDGIKGNYTETDPPAPTNYYALTKVAAEQAVSVIPNSAIIRLDFFPLNKLKYNQIFIDHFTSKIPVTEAAYQILKIVKSKFVGIINIGQGRNSLYNILKPYFPGIIPSKIEESTLPSFPKDISLDLTKWRNIFE